MTVILNPWADDTCQGNREQEIAAPMIMSYLMGYGHRICSHHYVPIYWASFDYVLRMALTKSESDTTCDLCERSDGACLEVCKNVLM